MIPSSLRTFGATVAVVGTLALGACESGPAVEEQTIGFSMVSSHDRILSGETVTLTTSSMNTLGRQAEVRWHAGGADLKTSDNGRVAQVTFAEPGTYMVSADLIVDGERMQTQSTTIEVRPLVVPGGGRAPDALNAQDAQNRE